MTRPRDYESREGSGAPLPEAPEFPPEVERLGRALEESRAAHRAVAAMTGDDDAVALGERLAEAHRELEAATRAYEAAAIPLPEGEKCAHCGGKGRRIVAFDCGSDIERHEAKCPDCHGTGKKPLPEAA